MTPVPPGQEERLRHVPYAVQTGSIAGSPGHDQSADPAQCPRKRRTPRTREGRTVVLSQGATRPPSEQRDPGPKVDGLRA